ncbi:uncharacterized protein [Coffea arabica]|uniref:RNase H type-1 domain-containing protein n=1 Tax=Coffea arabica TaxID=13443 RepID=A0ABM4V9U2_COFAR
MAAGDGLVRNHQGEVIFAFYKEFGDVDVLAAESLSLLFGLTLCVQSGMDGFAVEVDSAVLASVQISHVFREANGAADKLASLNLGSQRVFNLPQELPSAVKAIVALDSMSFPNFRTQVVRESFMGKHGVHGGHENIYRNC